MLQFKTSLSSIFFIFCFLICNEYLLASNLTASLATMQTPLQFHLQNPSLLDTNAARNQLFDQLMNLPPSLTNQRTFKSSGTESGGGGTARICKNQPDNTLSVDLLDQLEAQNKKIAIHPDIRSAQNYLEILNRVANKANTIDPKFGASFKRELEKISTIWQWTNLKITTHFDLGNIEKKLILPNCYLIYIGFYVDSAPPSTDVLKVDAATWSLLSEVDRAVFLIHEVLYKMARKNQHTALAHVIREASSNLLTLSDISVLKAARFSRYSSYLEYKRSLIMSSNETNLKNDPTFFLKSTDHVEFNILSLINRRPLPKACVQPEELSLTLDLCADFSTHSFFMRTYFCSPLMQEKILPTSPANTQTTLNTLLDISYASYLKAALETDHKLNQENATIYYLEEPNRTPYYFRLSLRSKNLCASKPRSSLVAFEDVHIRSLTEERDKTPLFYEIGDQSRLKKETNIQMGVDFSPEGLPEDANYYDTDAQLQFLVKLKSN